MHFRSPEVNATLPPVPALWCFVCVFCFRCCFFTRFGVVIQFCRRYHGTPETASAAYCNPWVVGYASRNWKTQIGNDEFFFNRATVQMDFSRLNPDVVFRVGIG